MDLIFNAVPLLALQGFNNFEVAQQAFAVDYVFEFSNLQKAVILTKLALIADILLELIIYCCEYCRMVKMHGGEVLADEFEKRSVYAGKVSCRTFFWFALTIAGFVAA